MAKSEWSFMGKVEGVYICPPKSRESVSVGRAVAQFGGFIDDRHFGLTRTTGNRDAQLYPKGLTVFNNRQLSIVSERELEEIARNLNVSLVHPEWLSANILLGICTISNLEPYSRLKFDRDVIVTVTGGNKPCTVPGEVLAEYYLNLDPSEFPKAAHRKRGVVGFVERPGKIEVGQRVEYHPPLSEI